jgi:hypothetical protein
MITLTIMGLATTLISVLPTYGDIGLAAPVFLVGLRCLQGLSMGGEWGGAVLLALEHAPAERRTLWGAIPQLGSPIGLLLSTGAFLAVSQLPDDAFESWGWRIPFLLAAALLVLGIWARRHVLESPDFVHGEARRIAFPLKTVVRRHPRALLGGFLLAALPTGGYYLATTFTSSYVVDELGRSRDVALVGQLTGASVQMVLVPVVAMFALGRDPRRWTLVAAVVAAIWAAPFYGLVQSGVPAAVWTSQAVAMVMLTITWALLPVILGGQFPVGVRYTGVSLAMQGASVLGGLAPIVATGLLAWSDAGIWPIAGLLVIVALSSATGCLLLRDTVATSGGGASLAHDAGTGAGLVVAQEESL